VFNINVRGPYLTSKYTIPYVLKQGKGCIVNISSVLGLKVISGAAAYNATKGTVTQLTRSMALGLQMRG
jgi:NAD(P)-dependent dehydrogenase (short-subunit alcohol dehydrogenase family)